MRVVVACAICVAVLGACSSHGSDGSRAIPPASSTAPTTTVPRTAATETSTTLSAAKRAVNAQIRREVAITSCGPNRLRHVEIKGSARNPTTDVVMYTVQLTVSDASGKHFYATAASAGRVAPAQKVAWIAETTAPYVAGMKCSIAGVSRRPE